MTGTGGFVAPYVARELVARDHELASPIDPVDAFIHVSSDHVRMALDDAWARGARTFVLLSMLGASARAREATRAAAGRAEELVRASGLRWAALRPDVLWGGGDDFTTDIARLLRHLPFVPRTGGGVRLAPVHVTEAAEALVWLVENPAALGHTYALRGPEELRHGDVIERVALALHGTGRRRLRVPSWSIQHGWRARAEVRAMAIPFPGPAPLREMSVESLRDALVPPADLAGHAGQTL